jgi:hypothetical protein
MSGTAICRQLIERFGWKSVRDCGLHRRKFVRLEVGHSVDFQHAHVTLRERHRIQCKRPRSPPDKLRACNRVKFLCLADSLP